MSPTVWFIVPDDPRPVGGILAIYSFVDDLNASGMAAWVVHDRRGFRCEWIGKETPVTWLDDVELGVGDVLAVPEILVGPIAAASPGTPMVIMNQNPYLTFKDAGLPPAPPPVVLPDSALGIVTVSDDACDYLRLVFPGTRVERVHYCIDSRLPTDVEEPKEDAIAFMPRRRYVDLEQVLRILERRGALDGWRLYPIDRLGREGRNEVLRRSALFLSFSEREGFGLPPLEAMAAGCVVIGFDGRGGREYLRPEVGFPIEEAAIAEYVRTVESVMHRWKDGDRFTDLRLRAAAMVASEYSAERQRGDVVRVFSDVLERAAGIPPGTPTLRP